MAHFAKPSHYGAKCLLCRRWVTTNVLPFQWNRRWAKPPDGQQLGSSAR
jgi:hypothetical protein